MLQFHWHCSSIGSGLVDRQEASNSGEAGLSELAAFLFLKAFMHSFLGYVVQTPSLMTNFFALFRVARLCYYWCTLVSFPPVFCSSVCVQYNTWKRKSTKNGEGLGTPIRFGKGKWRETVVYANVILTEGGQNPVMSFTHKQYLQSWRGEIGV